MLTAEKRKAGSTKTVDEDGLSALLDDGDFKAIHARMSHFNLFEAVGGIRGELRHSNFLAYLLSPGRPHGLGTKPLVAVLRAVLEQLPAAERPVMTLELITGELDDAVVHRERDNIDLLIEAPSIKLVVCVENKVDTGAGKGQLERYRTLVEGRYASWRKLYVFLTPAGADPGHAAYIAFSYALLAQVLEALAEEAPSESAIIIRHYVQMLRRHIVPDPQLKALARRLYERHSEALNFIFESRPLQADLLGLLAGQVEDTSGLIVDSRGANVLRVLPEAWDGALSTITCDPALWSHTGRAVLFELKCYANTPGRVNLSLLIGPAAPEARVAFYEAARDQPDVFRGLVKPMGGKWVSIFSQDLLTSSQAKELNLEQQVEKAALAWAEFRGGQWDALTEAVLHIEATRQGSG